MDDSRALGWGGASVKLMFALSLSIMPPAVLLWSALVEQWLFISVIAALLIGLLLSALLIYFLFLRPLYHLLETTKQIVQKRDFSRTLTATSQDELGQLTWVFSQLCAEVKNIPDALQETVESLQKSVSVLHIEEMEQNKTITLQATALQQAQVTAQELNEISRIASQKAEAVLEFSQRADELGRLGEATIIKGLEGFSAVRSQVEEISKKIQSLSERTQRIALITEAVKGLTRQSSMLALNASIEAARAGEHGKSFLVVAREIKTLSEQSLESTTQVRTILGELREAIEAAAFITEQGAPKIEGGLAQMKTSGESLRALSSMLQTNVATIRQIAAASSQQGIGVSQLFTVVSDLNKLTESAVQRLQTTTRATESLLAASQKISQAIQVLAPS